MAWSVQWVGKFRIWKGSDQSGQFLNKITIWVWSKYFRTERRHQPGQAHSPLNYSWRRVVIAAVSLLLPSHAMHVMRGR